MSSRSCLSLETFAAARAEIDAFEQAEAVLAQVDLTEAGWRDEVEAWLTTLGEDLDRGNGEMLLRYTKAYEESFRFAMERGDDRSRAPSVSSQLVGAETPPVVSPVVSLTRASFQLPQPTAGEVTLGPSTTAEVDMGEMRKLLAQGPLPFRARSEDATNPGDSRAVVASLGNVASRRTELLPMFRRKSLLPGADPDATRPPSAHLDPTLPFLADKPIRIRPSGAATEQVSLERYVRISIAMSTGAATEDLLQQFGLSAPEWEAIAARWSERIANDRRLLREWQILVSTWKDSHGQ